MTDKPRECPFCGKPSEPFCDAGYWWIECEGCGASSSRRHKLSDAIADWNRRTPPPDTANVFQTWRNELAKCGPDDYVPDQIRRVLAEWPQPEDPAHAAS